MFQPLVSPSKTSWTLGASFLRLLPPNLTRLKLISIDHANVWKDEYEKFVAALADVGNQRKNNSQSLEAPLSQLNHIDLRAVRLSSESIGVLKSAFSGAELLYTPEKVPIDFEKMSRELHFWTYGDGPTNKPDPEIPMPIGELGDGNICYYCHSALRKNTEDDHSVICPDRKNKKCALAWLGCTASGSTSEMNRHLKTCSFYATRCFDCGTTISRSQYDAHAEMHEKSVSKVYCQYLSRSQFCTTEFLETNCLACKETFDTKKEAQDHQCSQKDRKEKLHDPLGRKMRTGWDRKYPIFFPTDDDMYPQR